MNSHSSIPNFDASKLHAYSYNYIFETKKNKSFRDSSVERQKTNSTRIVATSQENSYIAKTTPTYSSMPARNFGHPFKYPIAFICLAGCALMAADKFLRQKIRRDRGSRKTRKSRTRVQRKRKKKGKKNRKNKNPATSERARQRTLYTENLRFA